MSTAPPAQDNKLLTVIQAADVLGISRRQLYNLINAGEITTIRIPSRTGNTGEHRIEPQVIEDFKNRHRQVATTS